MQMTNFERIHNDNLVVGHYKGMAIIKNEIGRLFYMICESNEAPIGTIVDEDALESILALPEYERNYIYRIFGSKADTLDGENNDLY